MFPNEEEPSEGLGALLRQSYGASEPTDQFVDRLHQRLLSEWADSNQPGQRRLPAWPWYLVTHWIGGLTMKQRMAALGCLGLAALLGFLLLRFS